MLHRKSVRGPVLFSGGVFYMSFGEFAKVDGVILTTDLDAKLNSGIIVMSGWDLHAYPTVMTLLSGYTSVIMSGQKTVSSGMFSIVSGQGNYVRVNVEKKNAFLSGEAWAVAASGDVIGNTFNLLADGE